MDALGWVGSALLVWSLLQTAVLRFRVLNLVASLALVAFNAIIAVWPMVALNVVIAGINVWHIARLLRTRHDERAYEVVEVGPDEAYLRWFLRQHESDIARWNPSFSWPGDAPGRSAFLVMRGPETIGAVLVRDAGDGVAAVELDYVVPEYRDFTPGEFVYRRSGLFQSRGFRRIVAPAGMRGGLAYFTRVGFSPGPDGTPVLHVR